MTKSNPFEAAIVLLREFLGVRTLNGIPFDGASLVPALNVLEAAGRINRHLLQKAIDHMPNEFLTVAEWKLVNDLSEALPGEPQ